MGFRSRVDSVYCQSKPWHQCLLSGRYVSINLRSSDGTVTKQRLNVSCIHSSFQERSGERMSKLVEAENEKRSRI